MQEWGSSSWANFLEMVSIIVEANSAIGLFPQHLSSWRIQQLAFPLTAFHIHRPINGSIPWMLRRS